MIVWPYDEGGFDADPQTLLSAHLGADVADMTDLWSNLIAYIARHRRSNACRLATMLKAFRIGACLLAIQIVLTFVAITAIV